MCPEKSPDKSLDMSSRDVLWHGRWQENRTRRFDEVACLRSSQTSIGDDTTSDEVWLFSLEQWLVADQKLDLEGVRCGLVLSADDDMTLVQDTLARFTLIVIDFPHFNDGRGFSLAAQLRERFCYAGQLRAEGYLLVDQLYYLKRCGFDSFSFRNSVDREEAIKALQSFSVNYQSSATESV